MAAQMKQMLNSPSNTGGSHKDITGKYREILEKVFKFQEPSLSEALKVFIEAGKFNSIEVPVEFKEGTFRKTSLAFWWSTKEAGAYRILSGLLLKAFTSINLKGLFTRTADSELS